jgi:hypothetical protein
VRCRATAWLVLEMDVDPRLPRLPVADDETVLAQLDIRVIDGPGAAGSGAQACSMLPLPVDHAEHQLQMLSDARSPASLQLLGYASARQACAAWGPRRLRPRAREYRPGRNKPFLVRSLVLNVFLAQLQTRPPANGRDTDHRPESRSPGAEGTATGPQRKTDVHMGTPQTRLTASSSTHCDGGAS